VQAVKDYQPESNLLICADLHSDTLLTDNAFVNPDISSGTFF